MSSLYRVRRAMAKPIKCIALGNCTLEYKKGGFNIRPLV
jgi:hypothetical protein